MKAFARHRTIEELRLLCRDLGLPLQDGLYRRGKASTVLVGCKGSQNWVPGRAYVVYDPGSGHFFGMTAQGIAFDSATREHDGEAWFEQLQQLFYAERVPA